MAAVSWLAPLPESRTPFVDAPDRPPEEIVAARERVDESLIPRLPLWYRTVAVLGWGWYPVATLIVLGLCLIAGLGTVPSVITALLVGPAFALVSAVGMANVARNQATKGAARERVKEALADSSDLIRLALPSLVQAVDRIMEADPARERDVHELAWHAAGDAENDPDVLSAAARLHQLVEETHRE